MSDLLWGVYPYACFALFFLVPILRMIYRPFGFSTRASTLFNRQGLAVASHLMHWGLLLLLVAHIAGFVGGLMGAGSWIAFFYWSGLVGGLSALLGSAIALWRRYRSPEVRAMSQWDDYLVHFFLLTIIGLGLYQVIVHRIFGVAYTASAWLASIARFAPQPELLDSASFISKLHIFLALTFFGLFPFTKLVHFWTYPFNYFVRPYQSMRGDHFSHRRKWEFGLRTDKSYLVYGLGALGGFFVITSLVLLGKAGGAETDATAANGQLMGYSLYVSQCARCHGLEGHGDGPGAASPTFARPPRDLTAGKYHFVSTTTGIASDADLARVVRNGLVPAGMPAFPNLSAAQVDSLVAVLGGMWVNRPAAAPAIAVPPKPAEANAARGKELYATLCVACHGASGQGDGPAAVGLAIPPANLAAGKIKAGSRPEDIYWRVTAGILPAGMPPSAATLPEIDRWSLVEYLTGEMIPKQMANR